MNEGWNFLLKGNLANLITGIPYTAMQFYFYEYFKMKLSI